ncbi:MAG: 5'-nucleotidase C-terminal domain-containing protein [Prevotella sp.]|nr:5'-nucleotidase C-terminal domain-containing protein [Prevotella sp.]
MKKTTILCLMALLMLQPAMAKKKTQTVTLRIVETSDVHGSFFPYDFITRKPKRGTLARVSTYVNKLRAELGENVILVDNGDILQGQPTCYYYNYIDTESTNVAADVINYMHYDAETFGNHDVETGHACYDKWIKEVNCPMLGANIIDTQTGKPYVPPYTILNRQGVKIAIIGMITPAIPNWLTEDIWSGLRFDEMVSTARYWMDYLQKNEHPDVVVGLFHSGKEGGIKTAEYEEDASIRVAQEVPGFDLVLFGHDHTRHNEVVTNVEGKPVTCLDPANNAISVADATIQLTLRKGKVISKTVSGNIVDVVDEPLDEAYMEHFKPHMEKVSAFVNRQIGVFKNTISTRDSYFGNSAFNDFILNLQLQITGADISFNAPLSFDASIKKGPVTVSDMFNLYKFENQLYVMRLTGEEIRKHLEMSYDLWMNTMTSPDDHLLLLSESTYGDQQRLGFKNFSFNFDSAAGIDYIVDVTKPDGQKVKILQMSNGEPFDEAKWYKVAVNSYRGNGGGELLTRGAGIPRDELEKRVIWRSDRDQRYYLMKEIERMGEVDPQPNNNWKLVPEEWVKPAAERDRKILFKE